MEAEIERLHHSVDNLSGALTDLKADIARQADKVEEVGNRQSSDVRNLIDRLHETYKELLKNQNEAFKGFGDRLNDLVNAQHAEATALRMDMRTDFARVVDRQDSHFRWLVGIAVSVALALVALLYKTLHP